MDREAFESDVWDNINDGLFDQQISEQEFGGICATIGETWQGALYGAEENNYGQRAVYLFEHTDEQHAWFEAVTADMGCIACNGKSPEHEDDCSRNDGDEPEDEHDDGEPLFSRYPGKILLVAGQGFIKG